MPQNTSLEPRVARLEEGMTQLAKTVNDLAITMRDNNAEVGKKLDSLNVAVTNAQAPKRTDWGTLILGLMLILSLGAAVLVPINNNASDNKASIQLVDQKFEAHQALAGHPLNTQKIEGLQKDLEDKWTTYKEQHKDLDTKIQRETQLMTDLVTAQMNALDLRVQKEFQALNTAMDLRVGKMEKYMEHQDFSDMDELRRWRLGELKK
jgi:uncharacterized coiled-coil protein SlyX